MNWVFFIFLDGGSHEELASKQVRGHEGAILRHANLIGAELHPVCAVRHYD